MSAATKNRLASCAASLLIAACFPQLSCGQAGGPSPRGKTQAVQTVKIPSAEGWQEAVSDSGRFRVLFPRRPEALESGDGPQRMLGFKLVEGGTVWTAIYNDFPNPTTDDEAQIREAYRLSAQSLTRRGAKVVRQEDVTLNGRLGTEIVMEARGKLSFIRAFLIGQRMYMLEADNKKEAGGDSALPKDVSQFFDSFTFWE